MSQYFNKNFFKFLFGFMAIIAISLLTVITLRIYQSDLGQSFAAQVIKSFLFIK